MPARDCPAHMRRRSRRNAGGEIVQRTGLGLVARRAWSSMIRLVSSILAKYSQNPVEVEVVVIRFLICLLVADVEVVGGSLFASASLERYDDVLRAPRPALQQQSASGCGALERVAAQTELAYAPEHNGHF